MKKIKVFWFSCSWKRVNKKNNENFFSTLFSFNNIENNLKGWKRGTILNSINNKFTRSHKITVKHIHDEHIYLMLPLQIKHSEDDNPPPYFYF